MAGYYELKQATDGQYHFTLKAGNHEVILSSERYTTRGAAENGIESCRTNSGNDDRYDRKESKSGQPFFNLKAANGQVIGTSEMYSSDAARENGIESVKTNGQGVMKFKED
ncbi:YegP family protein [Chromohalobacter nigrandesensis]|uniref:YegP family protein n=1 Tax=Chromohalobacter nigrandesensis TaxID=119863 RepID=UPI001FF2D4E3|nr:YegP family protein [Chromohalobacter nigrandesensis]MCK0744113.1 YegP family protein [Chromohalobacter nigrandesensis]